MSDDNKVSSLDEKRAEKQRADFAETVADNLGVTTEGLAAMTGDSVEGIRGALLEAMERQTLYRAHEERGKERERKRGMDPDRCCNGPCEFYVQREHEHCDETSGEITSSGRRDFCKEGMAQGCIFRLLEHPYSDPFVDIPSHNECVRVLQRIGYVRGDFEEEVGTNFMRHQATRKLWHAYVLLLVETGRVKIPEKEWKELSESHEDNLEHARFCGGTDLAHEYFRNTELPADVATIGELVAQRNALLEFIRGELDWPDGRCPCGEDVNWNGVAHTPKCRFNSLRGTHTGRIDCSKPNESAKPGWIVACDLCDKKYNGANHKECPACGTPTEEETNV